MQQATPPTKNTGNSLKHRTKIWLVKLDFGGTFCIPGRTKEEVQQNCYDRGIGIYTAPIKSIEETDVVKIGE